KDIRFTSKGDDTLYVSALGWPEDRRLLIRSLAQFPGVTGRITNVSLLGHRGRIAWKHGADGLAVELPAEKHSEYAIVLKVTGRNLRGFKPELAVPPTPAVQPDDRGGYTLGAEQADTHGALHTEDRGGQANLGFWDNASDSASWKVHFPHPGTYRVTASTATVHPEARLVLEATGDKTEGTVT